MTRSTLRAVCLMLAACASTLPADAAVARSAADFGNAETVEVKLSNFDFTPKQIVLTDGKPYLLRLINTASGGHDFTAPQFFAAARVAPEDAARVGKGRIKLNGHQAAEIHLVPHAGEFRLVCRHFGHSMLGMTGKIIVR